MKKLVVLVVCLAVLFGGISTANANENALDWQLKFQNNLQKTSPQFIDGKAYISIEDIAKLLDLSVSGWYLGTMTLTQKATSQSIWPQVFEDEYVGVAFLSVSSTNKTYQRNYKQSRIYYGELTSARLLITAKKDKHGNYIVPPEKIKFYPELTSVEGIRVNPCAADRYQCGGSTSFYGQYAEFPERHGGTVWNGYLEVQRSFEGPIDIVLHYDVDTTKPGSPMRCIVKRTLTCRVPVFT
ncbi:MAG TPA: hypothetical protein DCY27_04375 [Desulfobacterales bacterium]|nr:hypothetical protein [Desulfobacterales bacterium]